MSVNEKMTAIADAIRDKTKGTETLSLDDMAESIGDVYEAGKQAEYGRFWDGVFQNGARTDFKYGFAGDSWYNELLNFQNQPYTIRPYDYSTGTRAAIGMFYYFCRSIDFGDDIAFDMTEICKKIDMSSVLSAQSMFQAAYVKNVTLDLSNVTTINAMFAGNDGGYKNNITLKVSEKCTIYTNAFSYGTQITHLIFTDGSVIAASIDLKRSTALTLDSAKSVLRALKDYAGTDKEYTYTVSLADTVWDLLNADGATSPTGTTWGDYVNAKCWNV